MTKRLTVWYNPRESEHKTIRARLEQTGLDLTFIPTQDAILSGEEAKIIT